MKNKFLINTQPSGADVIYKDSVLGKTPLILYTINDNDLIKIKKNGYKTSEIMIDVSNPNIYLPLETTLSLENSNIYLQKDAIHFKPSIYFAGGSAIIFGVNAAWLKLKADKYYNEYKLNGDSNVLKRMKKYDRLSAVSLVACQLSSIMLTYLLLNN